MTCFELFIVWCVVFLLRVDNQSISLHFVLYSLLPAPFVVKVNLLPLNCLYTFVKNHLTVVVWVYFWILCSVSLTSVTVSPIPHSPDYCSCTMSWNQVCQSSYFMLLCKIILSSLVPYPLQIYFSIILAIFFQNNPKHLLAFNFKMC